MNRVECPMCHGEGFTEVLVPGGYFNAQQEAFYPLEQTKACELCRGSGSVEAPHHANTFNTSPTYAQLKETRQAKRSSTNAVAVAYILGITVAELEQSEAEKRAA